MSVIEPNIDQLLEETDNDRFLLCAISSKRARDVNDMMRTQRERARAHNCGVEVAKSANKKSLSVAFNEIASGDVSYDSNSIDVKNH